MRDVKILIMSVGPFETNWTAHYIDQIGGRENIVVCLPKQFEQNAESYTDRGIQVYVYDQSKYINDDFEFFGFKPRNCGGVGRQGIAEAVEKFADDNTIILELDDDTAQMTVRVQQDDGSYKGGEIRTWEDFKKLINAEQDFYEATGVELACQTGVSIPKNNFITNRKIFNNFIMHKGNPWNFKGFAALCSDDQRFNLYNNIINRHPMVSHSYGGISFHQNQGDRKDGNAPLYNSDYSWKKSYALKMMMPASIEQRFVKEENRLLFRENYRAEGLFPPICLENKDGEIVGRVA